ncbi:MAG: hypothetical protein KQI78_08000 [Deltaproteobacteria bacterium]|nr:hypothetical protein [Deltaproteobacteria bacterium]
MLKESSSEGLSEGPINNASAILYTPDKKLSDYLAKLEIEIDKRNKRLPDALSNSGIGKLMEQIAFLCFKGLIGYSEIKSFQSAGPQYDLIVTGDSVEWAFLCELLLINGCKDILIEVKAEKNPIKDQQFARLCSLLGHNLSSSGGLGVFFSLKGASGFPDRNSPTRQRSLSDARLRQAIFMASCKKPIIVFDIDDIYQLTKNGSLFIMLRNKIRDVEQLSGLAVGAPIENLKQCDLPKHLLELTVH